MAVTRYAPQRYGDRVPRGIMRPLITSALTPMDDASLAAPRPPPPALGTPPGSPPDSPRGSDGGDGDRGASPPRRAQSPPPPDGKVAKSARKYALEDAASPRDSQSTASTATVESKPPPHEEADEDEFHDIALDASVGVVPKSIFKEKRGGFLSRLRDASSSIVKNKYAPSDGANAAVVIPANGPPPPPSREPALAFTKEETEQIHRAMRPANENVEIVLEEDEPIDVAIEQTAAIPAPALPRDTTTTPHVTVGGGLMKRDGFAEFPGDDDADDNAMAPQVVIHSTESDSDSGFATLNPIINRQGHGKRGSGSSAIATGANPRVLLSLPIDEEAPTSHERLALVINALGATGLAKVEKFGTQSTLLELRLREATDDISSGASHLSFLRTSLHKKGGSEAQWNQQFTTALRSKTKQSLHIAVRTHSKLLVGETVISLINVGEKLYDQHFTIYRTVSEGRRENAGQVHLQLQIIPATQFGSVQAFSSVRDENRSTRNFRGPIPEVLRKGALMFKVPYHTHSLMGAAPTKRQWIAVSGDAPGETISITWCDPIDTTEKSRRLDICLITEVREGARTKAFERLLQSEPSSVAHERDRCFSIVSKSRTLDLVASSKEEARIWIEGLRSMIFGDEGNETNAAELFARTIKEFRHSALATRDPSTLSSMSTTTKKQQLEHWRSTIFEFARRSEIDFIASCLHDGCPVDLLETGSGDTLLMIACRQGDVGLVELCLHWRAKNDPHPEFGETALQVAVNAGNADCLGLILKTAADSDMDCEIVNHIDPKNDAPLHVAARKGDLACMQLLLHHGADICVVEEFGRTPLHCAVLSGSLDCVAYLLDVGGDSVLNAGDHDGDTALHYAALSGVVSIVRLLLESAADVQATNIHGETALDLARRERHGASEELISQYHHVTAPVPAVRNDPASSLLILHQKHEPVDNDETTDAMDFGDEEDDFEDQDPESFIEPSNSPVRRGPIERHHDLDSDCGDDEEYYIPHSARSSVSSSRSTQPISPSARIREVLASQRQRTSLHHPVPIPPLHFYSARDDLRSRFILESDYIIPTRQAYTERIPREQLRCRDYPHPAHPSQEGYYRPYERAVYPYDDHSRFSHSPMASRRHSMSQHVYDGLNQHPRRDFDDYSDWYDQNPSFASRGEVHFHPRQAEAWHRDHAQHLSHAPSLPPALNQPAAPDAWDMYYSDQGYPYYVNRNTGESQWENPYEPTPISPPSSVAQVAPHSLEGSVSAPLYTSASTVSHDVQVRIQRAAAREMRSFGAESAAEQSSSSQIPPAEVADIKNSLSRPLSISTAVDEPPSYPSSSLCESPSSKYEARTGLKLSIDVASPQRKDESRPVYVASPRARSPRKPTNGTDSEACDSSFEKSTRASSPRGKSKNVQIIELKRANNLAMALASFKINDRNDQIIQALTTLDERVVNAELLVCLQRFFPTDDEAAQLRSYEGPTKSLGPAERFFFQLLQVPDITQRIECFLYKLQFNRNYRSAYARIQATKRACRDLVDNYSFIQALSEFFKKTKVRSLEAFRRDMAMFRTEFLPRVDDKLHSFHDDFQKASEIELLDVELQINRLISGSRTVQAFVDKTNPPKDQDVAAHDILHRFLADTRGKLLELEVDFESLGQWEIKVLDLFGESKASCQLTSILECMCSLLDKA